MADAFEPCLLAAVAETDGCAASTTQGDRAGMVANDVVYFAKSSSLTLHGLSSKK